MMIPTPEQDAAIGFFLSGENLVVEAGAGTGKTSTLRAMAEHAPSRRGQYIAFNRAIVDEAGRSMPRTVRCRTAHSLAMKAIGHRFAGRLGAERMRPHEVAKRLGVEPIKVKLGQQAKMLQPGFLSGHVMRAIQAFCASADPAPDVEHFHYIDGIDEPSPGGGRRIENNLAVAEQCAPALARAWTDLTSETGGLRFTHDHYLKLWELSEPRIPVDYVLFDEAQDASPVMLSIVAQQAQHGTQLVYVGDSQQQIYEWRGAVNALDRLDAERTYLTQSFRFGDEVAQVANRCLGQIGADMRLTGNPAVDSRVVDHHDAPTAILCRTNVTAIGRLFYELEAGRSVHLVGGGGEVIRFARAAIDLRDRGYTGFPELACFTSWPEVVRYAEDEPEGADLANMVALVDKFGPEAIIDGLERSAATPFGADLVISTAHKAKGCEWPIVQLADDFPEDEDGGGLAVEEWRLMYVAATRAQQVLDVGGVAALTIPRSVRVPDRCYVCDAPDEGDHHTVHDDGCDLTDLTGDRSCACPRMACPDHCPVCQ